MLNIDGQALATEINESINHYEEERNHAVKSGWYEKAARLHLKIDGIKEVRRMIESGDFFINNNGG